MKYTDFQAKLEQQVKQEWATLIREYGKVSLKLFKSMQDVQVYREELVQLDYEVERLHQAMCFFKFYKPTKNPVYVYPGDDRSDPRGSFSDQLKSRLENYLSYGLKDVINDVIKFQDFIGGIDGDEYIKEETRYYTIFKNIFSEDVVNDFNPDSLSEKAKDIIYMYSEYAKLTVQELVQINFEDTTIYFRELAKNFYEEKEKKREKYCSEYSDKLKRMIHYEIQINDLSFYIQRFYFLCLCILKGKNLDIKDNFQSFFYDPHWWQWDPFNNKSNQLFASVDDESYGGFRKIMKSVFKDELTELKRMSDSKKEVQYKYLLDRLNFENLFE